MNYITEKAASRLEFWTFIIFCLSTIFIVIFSVEAIYKWPALIKQTSILVACLLPAGLILFRQITNWSSQKKVPKEILWIFILFVFGVISSLLSETTWASLRSATLFILSGPLIFYVSRNLFKKTNNLKPFLWLLCLILLFLCSFGVYEYLYYYRHSGGIHLFSRNPLPAGALLILLSAGPMILLSQENILVKKFFLSICLIFATALIFLIAKKGPLLGLAIIILLLAFSINKRFMRLLVFLLVLAGVILFFSDSMRSKYKTNFYHESSISLRAENYFFGFHVFKNNPFFGIGLNTDLSQYLNDYEMRFADKISKDQYSQFVQTQKTLENIIMEFLVEMGGLFTISYFGGVIYILVRSFSSIRTQPDERMSGIFIFSIIIGFIVISFTFDTLKFPNLNWLFHSLLGLMVNSFTIDPIEKKKMMLNNAIIP